MELKDKSIEELYKLMEGIGFLPLTNDSYLSHIGSKEKCLDLLHYIQKNYKKGKIPLGIYSKPDEVYDFMEVKLPAKLEYLKYNLYTEWKVKKVTKEVTFKGFKLKSTFNIKSIEKLYFYLNREEIIDSERTPFETFIEIFQNKDTLSKIYISNTTAFALIYFNILLLMFPKLSLVQLESSKQFISPEGKLLTANNISAQKGKIKTKKTPTKEGTIDLISEIITNIS